MLWRKALIYWRSVLVVCAIAYVSLLREPSVALPPIVGIASEWYRCGNGIDGWRLWQWWLVVVVFPIIYGGFIEILQEKYFYPRTGDWADWLADCAGVGIGIGVWWIGRKWHARRMAK